MVRLGELMMILELHRRGLSITASCRICKTGPAAFLNRARQPALCCMYCDSWRDHVDGVQFGTRDKDP